MSFKAGTISITSETMGNAGVTEGGQNRPDTNAASPDKYEAQATNIANGCAIQESTEYKNSLTGITKKISQLDNGMDALLISCQVHAGHDLARDTFIGEISKNNNGLVTTCANEMEARAALNAFKHHNNIKGPAIYPEDRLYHFSIIIAFIVIETAINSSFYETGDGLLAAATLALVISAANMAISVGTGFAFRYHNLIDLKYKIIGYGSLAVFVLAAPFLNLLFAIFRVQFQIMQSEIVKKGIEEPTIEMGLAAGRATWNEAVAAYSLNMPNIDFISLMLFIFGMLFSIIAFRKGYEADDKYPGYGEIDRIHKGKSELFDSERRKTFDTAQGAVTKLMEEIDQLRREMLDVTRNIGALKAELDAEYAKFTGDIAAIQSELNLVVNTYRTSNRATRTTQAPNYFNIAPTLEALPDHKTQTAFLSEELTKLSNKYNDNFSQWSATLGDRKVQIMRMLTNLINEVFEAQIEDIRKRAETLLSTRGQI